MSNIFYEIFKTNCGAEMVSSLEHNQIKVKSDKKVVAASNISLQSSLIRDLPCAVGQSHQVSQSSKVSLCFIDTINFILATTMNFKNQVSEQATKEHLRSSNEQLPKPQPLAPPVVTSQNDFQKQSSLRTCRQQLDTEKEVNKSNKDNSECTNPSQPNKVLVLSRFLINNIELLVCLCNLLGILQFITTFYLCTGYRGNKTG